MLLCVSQHSQHNFTNVASIQQLCLGKVSKKWKKKLMKSSIKLWVKWLVEDFLFLNSFWQAPPPKKKNFHLSIQVILFFFKPSLTYMLNMLHDTNVDHPRDMYDQRCTDMFNLWSLYHLSDTWSGSMFQQVCSCPIIWLIINIIMLFIRLKN